VKRDTRADILKVGTDIIARQGFNATGIDAVLKGAGVPKGSFYHYFSSKEAFGLAVLDGFAERYGRKLDEFFSDPSVRHLQRLRNYLDYSMERVARNGFAKGCLVGSLGQELADQHEPLRRRIDEIFQDWQRRFAACFRAAQEAGELSRAIAPERLAAFLLDGLEGALLRAKVTKTLDPIREFVSILFDRVLAEPQSPHRSPTIPGALR